MICMMIFFDKQELGADANLYAYVFGESVLNDAVSSMAHMATYESPRI